MRATPGTRGAWRLAGLARRMKRAWRASSRREALQLVAMTQNAHNITTLMIAAFHENWTIRLALSADDAMALLRKAHSAAVIYDWDSDRNGWRRVCGASVERGMPFYLTAEAPPDDLFLAVACAGGASVLWKPLRAEEVIAVVRAAGNIAADATAPGDTQSAAAAENANGRLA